jgi:hypothetical protein
VIHAKKNSHDKRNGLTQKEEVKVPEAMEPPALMNSQEKKS